MMLSVPGNLLLAGEYLVLDEGGQGLAVAVEPRLNAKASASPDGVWSIRAIMGEKRLLWQADGNTDLPLAGAMISSCATALEVRGKPMPPPLAIEVDSSAFFAPGGRKAGFGSSAAAAVAIAMLIGRTAGLEAGELIDFTADAALAGHRASQGGRGSGYDVFASLHGGCGIFTGGLRPGWHVLGRLPTIEAVLVPGPAAVRSSEAVEAFRLWLTGHAAEARSILDEMQAGVVAMAAATVSGDAGSFCQALDQAGAAGRRLGTAIGFSASIDAPPGSGSARVKALGAGNELGLLITGNTSAGRPGSIPAGCLAFKPTGGPLWLS